MMSRIIIIAILFAFTSADIAADNETIFEERGEIEKEQTLSATLLKNYDKSIRPVVERDQPVTVKVHVEINKIVDINEREEHMHSLLTMVNTWGDVRLKWNEYEEFGEIHSMDIPLNRLWTPDIVVTNADQLQGDVLKPSLSVYPNGFVILLAHLNVKTTCVVDLTKFPFDEQTCLITFLSNYLSANVNITTKEGCKTPENLVGNNEWSVISTSGQVINKKSCCDKPVFSYLVCTVTLKRASVYYTHLFLLPAVILALLVPMQFCLPPDSKERVTLGCAMMIGIIMLLLMMQSFLPNGHVKIPIIGLYYMVTLTWIGMSLMVSILVIHIHNRGPRRRKVPDVVRTIFLRGLKRLVCLGGDAYYPLDEMETITMRGLDKTTNIHDVDYPKPTDMTSHPSKLERDVEEILKHMRTLATKEAILDARLEIRSEWQQVAMVVDRILCFLFMLIFFISTFVLLG